MCKSDDLSKELDAKAPSSQLIGANIEHSTGSEWLKRPSDVLHRSDGEQVLRRSESLHIQIRDLIRAAVIAGELKPNTLYSVNQFAELLGVSRTPVREALLDLTRLGFLQMDRNRGVRVVVPKPSDVREIIELRCFLEIPAIEKLARLKPRPQFVYDQAREVYRKLQHAADGGLTREFLVIDREFHLLLISALGNERLTRLVGDLRDHMHLPGLHTLAAERRLHESGREHLMLLEALEEGLVERATDIMRAHLHRTYTDWA